MACSSKAFALVALLLLTACAGTEPEDDVVRVALSQQPECLDPQVSPREVTATVVRGVFDSLVELDQEGVVRPWLAERWEITRDRRSFTFHLRGGVTFHDGTPLDAEAVRATLDHATAPATKSRYAAMLLRRYAGSDILDSRTIRVHLTEPDASFLQALSTAYLGIQSPTSMRVNAGDLCARPVGSGPFRFAHWRRNRDIRLDRYAEYRWSPPSARTPGPAAASGVQITFIPEDGARFGALVSGQADVVTPIPPVKAGVLRADRNLRLLAADLPGVVYTVCFNSTSGPLADERVRHAVRRSVRIDELVRAVHFGEYPRAWSMLGPATPAYAPDTVDSWPVDTALAERLLDEAGWTGRDEEGYRVRDGQRLVLNWPYLPETQGKDLILLQGVQAEVRRLGIDLHVTAEDAGTYVQLTYTGRGLDMFGTNFVRADPDVLRYWLGSGETLDNGGGNVFRVRDPVLDTLLDQGLATDDLAARVRHYRAVQHYVNDRALVMPVFVPRAMVGTSSRLNGLAFEAAGYPLFRDVTTGRS
ncbi:ABC transporter substrate-binding protein [Saccharothrix obliqua]|uniref:ABC transporter substrate-binding protein n=1 Tax=Saccharothrix obliqua TaxID=2861747 RepID=UPI001C5FCE1B|nr:ABC transporter substrate-binding protein [Saccharothrix obliqua]MBW4717870.1 ABC transporter substrate-binding protein [Saccharothrix obliqua]